MKTITITIQATLDTDKDAPTGSKAAAAAHADKLTASALAAVGEQGRALLESLNETGLQILTAVVLVGSPAPAGSHLPQSSQRVDLVAADEPPAAPAAPTAPATTTEG